MSGCCLTRCFPLTQGQDSEDSTKPYLILITESGKSIRVENSTENLQKEPYFHATDPVRGAYIHGMYVKC